MVVQDFVNTLRALSVRDGRAFGNIPPEAGIADSLLLDAGSGKRATHGIASKHTEAFGEGNKLLGGWLSALEVVDEGTTIADVVERAVPSLATSTRLY